MFDAGKADQTFRQSCINAISLASLLPSASVPRISAWSESARRPTGSVSGAMVGLAGPNNHSRTPSPVRNDDRLWAPMRSRTWCIVVSGTDTGSGSSVRHLSNRCKRNAAQEGGKYCCKWYSRKGLHPCQLIAVPNLGESVTNSLMSLDAGCMWSYIMLSYCHSRSSRFSLGTCSPLTIAILYRVQLRIT